MISDGIATQAEHAGGASAGATVGVPEVVDFATLLRDQMRTTADTDWPSSPRHGGVRMEHRGVGDAGPRGPMPTDGASAYRLAGAREDASALGCPRGPRRRSTPVVTVAEPDPS